MSFSPRLLLALLACGALSSCGGGGGGSAPAATTPTTPTGPALTAPTLPRTGLVAADLAVIIAQGDATSEAIGLAYQQARGIPEANMIRVPVPTGSPVISAADFATLKAAIDAKLPATVQATLLTFTQPSRVSGNCFMGITSAMAFGYADTWCSNSVADTQASTYYDTDTTRPWTDLQIRPSMMLGVTDPDPQKALDAAKALIARGVAADGSAPTGTGYAIRSSDANRSARYPFMSTLPGLWSQPPGPAMRYIDASAGGAAYLTGNTDVLFYFASLISVPNLTTNTFLPGAAADTLTSFGGVLPDGLGQMPITDWLAAGATASYGTVSEPGALVPKFPMPPVLVEHYVRGATLIEAYWKSVKEPGQGLFVGEPLARPWSQAQTATLVNGNLVISTRSLRRSANYSVEYLASGSSTWQVLASITGGQPMPFTWTVPLPANTAGGQLRFKGPCETQPSQTCVLGQST
jgi:uncharacterized protein (TIGR03790 family)